jgi:hypothetical protein
MKITVQLTSHADSARGETDRMAEFVTLEFKRNGDKRDAFLRALVEDIKRLAKEHNARFEKEHGA